MNISHVTKQQRLFCKLKKFILDLYKLLDNGSTSSTQH